MSQAVFDTVLEAYSKVRKCSHDGRTMMILNVSELHEVLDTIHSCHPPKGRHHIESFVRAAFLPEEKMMIWIEENWQSFAYRHVLGLLDQTLKSSFSPKRLKDATCLIDGLYEQYNSNSSYNGIVDSMTVTSNLNLSFLSSSFMGDENSSATKITNLLSTTMNLRR